MLTRLSIENLTIIPSDDNPDVIHYWDGFIYNKQTIEECPQPFIDGFDQLMQQFRCAEYRATGLDLKQISNNRFYSMKTNRADRILFTTIMRDETRLCPAVGCRFIS